MRPMLWLLFLMAALPLSDARAIQGCVGKNGLLRVVDDASSCKKKERPIELAAAGEAGVPGPAGPQGPVGPEGPSAPENATCRVVARLTIEDVVGEGPGGSIDVVAYSFGVVHEPGSGSGSGVTTYQPLQVTKLVDGISPTLVENTAEGKEFPTATLDVLDGAGAVLHTYQLVEPIFVSLNAGGSTCGDTPQESIGLQFESITLQ